MVQRTPISRGSFLKPAPTIDRHLCGISVKQSISSGADKYADLAEVGSILFCLLVNYEPSRSIKLFQVFFDENAILATREMLNLTGIYPRKKYRQDGL